MWINCLVELFKGKHNESFHASKFSHLGSWHKVLQCETL